jgi:subtilisin family serine protease
MKKRTIGLLVIVSLAVAIGLSFMHFNEPQHDLDFNKQWGLYNDGSGASIEIDNEQCVISEFKEGVDIKYKGMWDALEGIQSKRDVVIAVIDTGIDFSGEDLKGTEWYNAREVPDNNIDDDKNGFIDDSIGWDFVNNTNQVANQDSMIDNKHGTMVAGIIAAEENGVGMEGITKGHGVKLMPLKVLSSSYDSFEGEIVDVVSAINYADAMGANICNLSFSSATYNRDLYETMKNSKMLFVVSAGNSHNLIRINIDKKNVYPACYDLPNIITVSNIGFDGRLYKDSNYGISSVDLVAPGTNIYSTSILGEYQYGTGSSFSAPYVTGVAAVLYRFHENPTAEKIKNILCQTVTKIDTLKARVRTGGMLNAKAAAIVVISTQGE